MATQAAADVPWMSLWGDVMAKGEITVRIADLPAVKAKLEELADIAAALRDEKPFPRTEIGDAVHNLRGRAETAELMLANLRASLEVS